MKNLNTNKLNLILLTGLGLWLAACGSSKTPLNTQSTSGSRDVPGVISNTGEVVDSTTGSTIGFYATCNKFSGNSVDGVLTSYFNPISNAFVSNMIRLELKSWPAGLTDGADVYLQIFRWQEDTPGKPVTNQQPVGMYFQLDDGTWLNDNPINSISKSQIETMISKNNLDSQNVTASNFLQKVLVVMVGMDLQYDAIMINTYDQSQGSSAIDTVNVLLPAFAADPNIYAATHSAASLQQLHPNYDIRNNGFQEYDYYLESQKLCN